MKVSRRTFIQATGMALLAPLTATSAESSSVTATPDVNLLMRAGPGPNHPQVGTIPYGTTVPVLATNRSTGSLWILVDLNGQRGWSAGWLVRFVGNLSTLPESNEIVTGSAPPPPAETPAATPDTPADNPPAAPAEPATPEAPAAPPSGGTGVTPLGPVDHWDGSSLGRILLNTMTVHTEPSWRSPATGTFYTWNQIVPVLTAVGGEGLYHTNHTWLQTPDGYIYSSWVQPCNYIEHAPTAVAAGGMWSEITVPIVTSKSGPGPEYYNRETHYYSQIQRVVAMENGYYKVAEIYGGEYWLPANSVRLMSADEWAPISTHVAPEAKKIIISVGDSRLRAYEGSSVVYDVPVSLGNVDTPTPMGTYQVRDKRHGQRMVGGLTGGGYNLAGIGSISYITSSWVAMHSTYWHNDYGRRHSNGCINLHPRDAKWIFRWTTPYANYWDFRTLPNPAAGQPGTTVTIQW